MNLPNTLTLLRIFFVPLLVAAVLMDGAVTVLGSPILIRSVARGTSICERQMQLYRTPGLSIPYLPLILESFEIHEFPRHSFIC